MATIESVKEKLAEAKAEIDILLEEADNDAEFLDDDTFDELAEIADEIESFLEGEDPQEDAPE